MKNFELPTYEKWKANSYEYRKVIGAYYCAIVRNPTDPSDTDTHSYILAVARDIIPERAAGGRKIFCEFECKDSDETSLISWYDSLQTYLNERWESLISGTYLADEYKALLQRDKPLERETGGICPICDTELIPVYANFCWSCGQRIAVHL